MKRCSNCKRELSFDQFHRDKGAGDGRARLCKPCANTRARNWYKTNPERAKAVQKVWAETNRDAVNGAARARYKADPARDLDAKLKFRYGITGDEFRARVALQHGLCALCGRPPGRQRLSVDHDHSTGKVRELLCTACNKGLGYFRDNPELMRKAAEYVERHQID